jgi:hypothetical protein
MKKDNKPTEDEKEKPKRERKPSMNLTLDEDVMEAIRDRFPGEGSRIFSGLGRAFIKRVDEEPELLFHVKRDEIGVHVEKRIKNK